MAEKEKSRVLFLVYSDPVEGREDEYNDWYDNQHIADVLAVPDVVAAQRYRLTEFQSKERPGLQKYMIIWEIETNDLEAVFKDINERLADGRTRWSTSYKLETASAGEYEPITERITKEMVHGKN